MTTFFKNLTWNGYGARAYLRKAAVAAILAVSALPAQAEVTIAALGDSLTHGFGVFQDDGLVPQLEKWLRAEGEAVRVLNAGVSGDTTAGGLARLDWTLTPEVDALIVTLGGNDLLRGIDPANSRANLDQIVTKAREKGLAVLLIGMPAPGNYGPEYKQDFDSIFPDLAQKHGVLWLPSLFEGLGDDLTAARGYFQSDGIHPNEEGVKRIVAFIGPTVQKLIAQVE